MVLFLNASRLALAVFDPYLSSGVLARALREAPPGQLVMDGAYYAFSSVFFYTDRTALLVNGRINNREAHLLTRNGERRRGLMSAEMVEIEGKPYVLTAVLDVTEYRSALDALGVPASGTVLHVGDSLRYDVGGALAAGLEPVHLDPHGFCPAPDGHRHVRTLTELAQTL